MDKCAYCGIEYHPMMRWVNPKTLKRILACTMTFVFEDGKFKEIIQSSPCADKAAKDGYIQRPDLTPKR